MGHRYLKPASGIMKCNRLAEYALAYPDLTDISAGKLSYRFFCSISPNYDIVPVGRLSYGRDILHILSIEERKVTELFCAAFSGIGKNRLILCISRPETQSAAFAVYPLFHTDLPTAPR